MFDLYASIISSADLPSNGNFVALSFVRRGHGLVLVRLRRITLQLISLVASMPLSNVTRAVRLFHRVLRLCKATHQPSPTS